ncbi:MAG: PAS domain S-box protein [Thermodesulfobacteriota bacterium]
MEDHRATFNTVAMMADEPSDKWASSSPPRPEQDSDRDCSIMPSVRFRCMVEHSPNALFTLDRAGRIAYWNMSCRRLTGWAPHEALGQTLSPFVMDESDAARIDALREAVFQGESFDGLELRFRNRDGSLRRSLSRAYPIVDSQGTITECALANTDVTYHARIEDRLANEAQKFRALYDLALAMTTERSLDENLELVTETSRTLLRGDTSYIALRDDAHGDVYMHVLSGIHTDEFKGMRIPFGIGLGGRVATSGRGLIIEDYFAQVGPELHRIVAAEGLISGLAVPIQMGNRNLGVLYVFNRRRTLFSKEDLDTLALLGSLAALEITRKRGEQELLRARSELKRRVQERTAELLQTNTRLVKEALQRQSVEEALRQSEERYRTLVEESFDGIFVRIGDKIAFANSRLHEMMGVEGERLEGRDPWSIFHPDDRKIIRERGAARLRGETVPSQYEIRLRKNDGTEFHAELHARLVQFAGELGIQVCVRDITERKRAAEALKESEEKYRRIIEHAGDAIFVIQDDALKLVNSKLTEIMRYDSPEALTSRPFLGLVHADDRQSLADHYRKILSGERLINPLAFRVLRGDESSGWVEANVVEIQWEGKPATLNFLRDTTAKLKMEEELLKVEKLGSIGILAGGIAHDFNNILTAILGNISMARMLVAKDPKAAERLTEAEKACLNAQSLTQQLLTFARGGAPIKKPTDISHLVKAWSLFALRGSNVRCVFSITDDLWPVEVDEGQMNQVINNLAINADQAMPRGGQVEVSADNINITDAHALPLLPGRYVRISMKDWGVGIPAAHIPHIYDPYFTTKQQGSGLGLATSYAIVKNHGGLITVESEIGVGTTFHMYLPACRKAIRPQERFQDEPVGGEGRILLMDDEEAIRELVAETLSLLGYDVQVTCDGSEAINAYRQAMESGIPFHAVIMDLTVPGGMGGKEAIEVLREIDPTVKALVSSGYSNDPVMAHYREYGFRGVVTKPYSIKDLTRTLAQVLQDTENSFTARGMPGMPERP